MTFDPAILLNDLITLGANTLLFVVLLFVASVTMDLMTPRHPLNAAMVQDGKGAVGVALAGYYLAIALIFIGASLGPSLGLQADLMLTAGYALLGILFLNLSRLVFEWLVFNKTDALTLVVTDNNFPVSVIMFGGYVATGCVAAASLYGDAGGVLSSVVFFVLGQIVLVALAWLYERVTRYNVQAALADGNMAAGLAFAGNLIGLGLILAAAIAGPFVDWKTSIGIFAIDAVMGAAFLIAFRLVVEKLLLRSGRLDKVIGTDANIAAGAIEAAAVVSVGTVVATLI